jgi:hypothetical protein
MMDLDQKRTPDIGFVATNGRGVANQLRHTDGRWRPQSGELANARSVLDPLADALIALAIAKKRLFNALRENESLRTSNDKLMHTLDDAARLAVAAQRVAHHDRLTGLRIDCCWSNGCSWQSRVLLSGIASWQCYSSTSMASRS